jgi:hypothetical protein
MSQRSPQFETRSTHFGKAKWDLMPCDWGKSGYNHPFFPRESIVQSGNDFSHDWANVVPNLISKLVSEVLEKKKMELRFSLMESAVSELKSQLNVLANDKTRIVPINTLAPEKYDVLKPILVSVQAIEDEFEAGWFDANIHTTGENEEAAVSNLKSLILDYFEIFTNEPPENLGIEPRRQLAILNQFIQKGT